MMTIHEQYNENLKFIDNLQKRKSKTEGSIETRNQEIIKIREEITKLSEKLKAEYNLDPANLLSRIEDLRTEFNENAEIIKNNSIKAEVHVVYQTVENLHQACPDHLGDWYFTGNYPTPGGNKVVNKAFMNYMEGKNVRGD